MARKILDMGTGAITDGNQVSATISAADFPGGSRPTIAIKGIAGAETVDLWVSAGSEWVELVDSSKTQVQFTATYSADVLNSAVEIGFTKSATAGALEVWLHTGR